MLYATGKEGLRMTSGYYRVTEFAEAAGVTVRTLHHYDELGLLHPSRRTDAGHRLYSNDELIRLQQILTLRHMGFALEEINELLAADEYDLQRSLTIQKEAVDREIARLQDVSHALENAIEAARTLEQPDVRTISLIIRGLTHTEDKSQWVKRYYSDEALERLQEMHGPQSLQDMAQAARAWMTLSQDFQDVRDLPPEHPTVQRLARRMHALVTQFTQGDPEIEDSLRRMYEDEDNMPTDLQIADPALQTFMGRALEIYRERLNDDES